MSDEWKVESEKCLARSAEWIFYCYETVAKLIMQKYSRLKKIISHSCPVDNED